MFFSTNTYRNINKARSIRIYHDIKGDLNSVVLITEINM